MITEFFKNANFQRNLILGTILVLTASAAFGMGRLSVLIGKKEPVAIEGYLPTAAATSAAAVSPEISPKTEAPPPQVVAPAKPISKNESATYVASKTGKNYYFPWCGTVKRIKPENLIYFNSKTDAENAGYKAGNCAGLK